MNTFMKSMSILFVSVLTSFIILFIGEQTLVLAINSSPNQIFENYDSTQPRINRLNVTYPECWKVNGAVHIYDGNHPTANNIPADLQFTVDSGSKIEALKITLLTFKEAKNINDISVTFVYDGAAYNLDTSYYEIQINEDEDVDIIFSSPQLVQLLGSFQIDELLKIIVDFKFDAQVGVTHISGSVVINNGTCPINTTFVSPKEPTLSDAKCSETPVVILPENAGIDYNVISLTNGYKVVATALDGYVFEPGVESEWFLPYTFVECLADTEETEIQVNSVENDAIVAFLPKTGNNETITLLAGSILLFSGLGLIYLKYDQ